MAFRSQPVDLEYDDEDMFDRLDASNPAANPPDYPPGCRFNVAEKDLEAIGCEGGSPGDVCDFAAMAEVTHCTNALSGCRVELEITQLAGDDGKFVDLSAPAHICLCDPELEKMGLGADCEVGDTIHLTGTMRLEGTTHSRGFPEAGLEGVETAQLQITHLSAAEDESAESR